MFTHCKQSIIAFFIAAALPFGFGCDIDLVEEGEAPEVEVKPGKLPKYDIDGPEVEVKTEKKQVEVPKRIEVHTETEEVEVPNVEVTLPGDDE